MKKFFIGIGVIVAALGLWSFARAGVGNGTITSTPNDIHNSTSQQTGASFNIDGSGTLGSTAGNISTATTDSVKFSNGSSWSNIGNTYTVGTFSNTSTANALDITGTVLTGHAADATNAGMLSAAADQVINPGGGNKQLSASGKMDWLVSAGTQPVAIGASGNQQLSIYRTTSTSAPYTWLENVRIKFSDGTASFGGLGDIAGISADWGNGTETASRWDGSAEVDGATFCAHAGGGTNCVTPGTTWDWGSVALKSTGHLKIGSVCDTADANCTTPANIALKISSAPWRSAAASIGTALSAAADIANEDVEIATTIKHARYNVQTAGVGAGSQVVSYCDGAGACTNAFITCTSSCTAAAGSTSTCTINTAALTTGQRNWRITTACTTSPQVQYVATGTVP